MSKPAMQSWRCNVHNIAFEVQELRDQGGEARLGGCPYCLREENLQLRTRAAQAEEHRDTLLKAIDLKRLLEPTHGA